MGLGPNERPRTGDEPGMGGQIKPINSVELGGANRLAHVVLHLEPEDSQFRRTALGQLCAMALAGSDGALQVLFANEREEIELRSGPDGGNSRLGQLPVRPPWEVWLLPEFACEAVDRIKLEVMSMWAEFFDGSIENDGLMLVLLQNMREVMRHVDHDDAKLEAIGMLFEIMNDQRLSNEVRSRAEGDMQEYLYRISRKQVHEASRWEGHD